MKKFIGILIAGLPFVLTACDEKDFTSWYPEPGLIGYLEPKGPVNLTDTSHYKYEMQKAARHAEYQTAQEA